MDIESTRYRIQNAPGGCGFTLTQKASESGPAWHMHLASVPSAHALAMMHEKQFNREAGEAMDSGEWPGA